MMYAVTVTVAGAYDDADHDGVTSAVPPLIVQLKTDPCTSYGPANRSGIIGWYRAFPLVQLGEF